MGPAKAGIFTIEHSRAGHAAALGLGLVRKLHADGWFPNVVLDAKEIPGPAK
jgi:hypothetical protein